jgi:predicted DsbA family dithiol-disulfide isomerase
METETPIRIDYFSDVLCVWAYTAQARLDELERNFGARIDIHYHFIPVFGCTAERIGEAWEARGGYAAYCRNVQEVCGGFGHVQVHPEIWMRNVPASSASCHCFLKAVQLLARAGVLHPARFDGRSLFEAVLWRFRDAFFRELRNIGDRACQLEIAQEFALPAQALLQQLDSGAAMAEMCRDLALQERYRVEGSPSYVLNEGRQKLYGNVGYRVIEANVEELLRRPQDQASWC